MEIKINVDGINNTPNNYSVPKQNAPPNLNQNIPKEIIICPKHEYVEEFLLINCKAGLVGKYCFFCFKEFLDKNLKNYAQNPIQP